MTVYKNDDILYGIIRYRRQTYPKGEFVLRKTITVAADDLIKIIGNYTAGHIDISLEEEDDGVTVVDTDNFTSATATFETLNVKVDDIVILYNKADAGIYLVATIDSETQLSLKTLAGDACVFLGDTVTDYRVGYVNRTVITGTDGAPAVGTDNFLSAGSTFITDRIAVGDMLIIEDGDDIGSYLVATIDSETQLSVTDHADSAASFSGDTSNTFQVGKIIYNARIEEVDYEKTPFIKTESILQEIEQVRPNVTYTAEKTGAICGDMVRDYCNYGKVRSAAIHYFALLADADVHTTDWTAEGAGAFYLDVASANDVEVYSNTDDAYVTFNMQTQSIGDGYIKEIKISTKCRTPDDANNLSVNIYIGGAWLGAKDIPVVNANSWFYSTWSDLEEYDQADLDVMQVKYTVDIKVGAQNVYIDYVQASIYYYDYVNIDLGSHTHTITLEGDKAISNYLDVLSLDELKAWYFNPSHQLFFNDADIDSQIPFASTDHYTMVIGKKAVKSYDKVVLYGGWVNGAQLTSTSGSGNIVWKDSYLSITVQSELDDLADQLLTEQAANHFIIQMIREDSSDGLYQIGETVSIAGSNIQFYNSSAFIPAGDYIINKIDYMITDGSYNYLDIELIDGLIFSTPKEDRAEKEAQATENSTGIAQVATGAGTSGLANVIEDTTPELGGALDCLGEDVDNIGDLIFEDGLSEANIRRVYDEDDMAADDENALATQQSIKAYVDAQGGAATLDELTDTDITGPTISDLLQWDGSSDWIDVNFAESGILEAAHAFVEANALTMENDIVFNGGQTFDGKDVSTLGTDAEAKTYIEANTKIDDLQTPDDNTDLDSTTTEHGLLKKLNNDALEFMNGQGNWAIPAGEGGGVSGQVMYEFIPIRSTQSYSGEIDIRVINYDFSAHFMCKAEKVDTSQNVIFHFGFRCIETDTSNTIKRFSCAIKSDKTEVHSWNIHNASEHTINTQASKVDIYPYTFAAGNIDDDDWLYAYFKIRETRTFLFSYCMVEYTHT